MTGRMRDRLRQALRRMPHVASNGPADARRPPGGKMHASAGHSHGPIRRFRWTAVRRAGLVIGAVACTIVLPVGIWIAVPLPADNASPAPVPSLEIQDRHGLPLRTTRSADGSRGGWTAIAAVAGPPAAAGLTCRRSPRE